MNKPASKLDLDAARGALSRHLVWDNHGCMPVRWTDADFLPQLERYRSSGFDVVSLNIGFGEMGVEDHVRVLAHFRRWLSMRPADYVLARTAADIRQARADGKLAIVFDVEGARGIDDQISLIQLYYDLGVRWMLMAYNRENLVGSGVHDPQDNGLTAYGREVVREMERVGMVVCCSHTGPRTAMDVMEWAERPVIFSHSNPKALWSHERNIDDALMEACAASGGVMGLNGVAPFLGDDDISTETFVRNIDYAVEKIGPDHVGLGLDFCFDNGELEELLVKMRHSFPDNAAYRSVPRFISPEQLVEITAALMGMGYSDEDLGKILGGNHLRVADEVWKPVS